MKAQKVALHVNLHNGIQAAGVLNFDIYHWNIEFTLCPLEIGF